jgi:hypothetical protein
LNTEVCSKKKKDRQFLHTKNHKHLKSKLRCTSLKDFYRYHDYHVPPCG